VHGQLAIELGPSVATNHATFAVTLYYMGEHAASLARMKRAIRLTSYSPDWYLAVLGDTYRSCGELGKARTVFEHLAVRMPHSLMSLTRLISIYSDLGETDRARQAADELMVVNPAFSVGGYMQAMPFKLESDRESLCNALLNAGLRG
jgi:tetratricopeptide (TPR) repeat protein